MRVLVLLGLLPTTTIAAVCFTPGSNCQKQIVNLIYSATHFIRMQSYTFTSYKIAHALVVMQHRGIDVQVIMDKSQFQCQQFSQRNYLISQGIKVFEDYKLNIAHNKVIIIDGQTVETGSYNYTASAQKYNAENVLILANYDLAQYYLKNWQRRRQCSVEIHSDRCTRDLKHHPIPSIK